MNCSNRYVLVLAILAVTYSFYLIRLLPVSRSYVVLCDGLGVDEEVLMDRWHDQSSQVGQAEPPIVLRVPCLRGIGGAEASDLPGRSYVVVCEDMMVDEEALMGRWRDQSSKLGHAEPPLVLRVPCHGGSSDGDGAERNELRHDNAKKKAPIEHPAGLRHSVSTSPVTAHEAVGPSSPFALVRPMGPIDYAQVVVPSHAYTLATTKTKPAFKIYTHDPKVDIYVSASIIGHGMWDEEKGRDMANILSQFPNSTFLDVGSNIGLFSLYAAKLGAKSVVAIEPMPRNYMLIAASVVANELQDIIKVYPFVAGEPDPMHKKVCLEAEANNQGHSFVTNKRVKNCQTEVATTSIDEILADAGVEKVDVLKIDVEGYEVHALRGMAKMFKSNPPCVVYFEAGTAFLRDAGSTVKELVDLLTDNGYTLDIGEAEIQRRGLSDGMALHPSCKVDHRRKRL